MSVRNSNDIDRQQQIRIFLWSMSRVTSRQVQYYVQYDAPANGRILRRQIDEPRRKHRCSTAIRRKLISNDAHPLGEFVDDNIGKNGI